MSISARSPKELKCNWCGLPIPAGERHCVQYVMLSREVPRDRRLATQRMHVSCMEAYRESLADEAVLESRRGHETYRPRGEINVDLGGLNDECILADDEDTPDSPCARGQMHPSGEPLCVACDGVFDAGEHPFGWRDSGLCLDCYENRVAKAEAA